jgi:hypothetical protein
MAKPSSSTNQAATAATTKKEQTMTSKPLNYDLKHSLNERPEAGIISSDLAAMLLEDEGAGREGITAKDLAIPRLSILQALSPVCTKGDPAYIKDAETGEIYDNIHGKRYSGETGIIVIPVTYRRTFLEWKPRKAGGGFVGDHGADPEILSQCTTNDTGQTITPDGNTLIQTAEYFCVMIDPESKLPRQVVISMSSTQFKKAKIWNSMITGLMVPRPDGKGVFNPAIFYQSYKLTTVPESNDKGSWFGWKVESYKSTLELTGGEDLYLGSRNFRKSVQAGEVKVADPESQSQHANNIIDADEI